MQKLVRNIALILPCVLALAAPLYNSLEPRLFGFPLFYWFLLLLIPFSSLCIYLAFKEDGH